MKTLDKAREYEEKNMKLIPAEQRPVFHLSSPVGWINDPNGFSEYQGEIHLFFQYNPYHINWDSMHWGHAKTHDFISWEYLPTALAPDCGFDEAGVFSGSAIEEDGKHILMYTGVEEIETEDGKREVRQQQCIAEGDGLNYKKLEENPVITADMLPKGSSQVDFRDPKIWKEDGVFYAAVGSRHKDGSGQIAIFSSENLKQWKFHTILDRCDNRYGKMWECPDFFPLGEKDILMVSPQDMVAEGLEFHNGNGVMFIHGSYDKKTMDFQREGVQSADYGLDFYAPQTMLAEDGRRIMIAWMKSWDTALSPEAFQWSSMMTVPRELKFSEGRIIQSPVREIENYHRNKVEYRSVKCCGEKKLGGIEGRVIDLTVEVESGEFDSLKICLADNGRFHSDIIFDSKESTITFDRTYAGFCRDIVMSRSMYVRDNGGRLKLRILMDRYSVEIFANDGEQAMTSLIYTEQEAKDIRFISTGEISLSVVKYDIISKN